ncbi:MAG: hypothetical protein HQ518_29595 [Rhodopirellula sp.]|nr:hypothetical protein [Rhodopirellula sp.]
MLPWEFAPSSPRSPVEEIHISWKRLLRRFERFNTRAHWQRSFALPKSLESGKLEPKQVAKTLKIMVFVDTHQEYHMVARLPEFRRLKRQLREFRDDLTDKVTR